MFFGLAGLLIISQPQMLGGEPLPAKGVLIALLGAVGSGAAYTLVRKLSNEEHPSVIILYFYGMSASNNFWLAVVHNAFGLGLFCLPRLAFSPDRSGSLTRGVALTSAGKATAYSYIQVVFAACLGTLFLEESLARAQRLAHH